MEQVEHALNWFWNGEGWRYHFCLIDQNGVLDALGYGGGVAQAHQILGIRCRSCDLTHLCSRQRTDRSATDRHSSESSVFFHPKKRSFFLSKLDTFHEHLLIEVLRSEPKRNLKLILNRNRKCNRSVAEHRTDQDCQTSNKFASSFCMSAACLHSSID